MAEALGVTDVRKSTTAPVMKKNLARIISQAKGRVIIGTFASQIERISWIIGAAEKHGKKVAIDGYSMKTNIDIAKAIGYIKVKKDTLIPVEKTDNYPDNKLVIIVTGSQGEDNAVFSRMVSKTHRSLRIKKTDTIIFSSSIIPGNEHMIQKLKDSIYRQSENVIHNEIMDIHVSGHANREDNIQMLEQVKPDYYIPTYAWHYMLIEAAKLAKQNGMKQDRIFVLDNGQVAEFDGKTGRATEKHIPCDYVLVDDMHIGEASSITLDDRRIMAEEGIMIINSTIDKRTGKLIRDPEIISRGFVYMKESKELTGEIRRRVRHALEKYSIRRDRQENNQENGAKNILRDEISNFLYHKTQRRPMVIAIINRI
jgi:ribonuclease J